MIAAGLNPIDYKKGLGAAFAKPPLYHGSDVVGTIVALGPGVTSVAVGDVVCCNNGENLGATLAQYAIAGAGSLGPVPKGWSSKEVCCDSS